MYVLVYPFASCSMLAPLCKTLMLTQIEVQRILLAYLDVRFERKPYICILLIGPELASHGLVAGPFGGQGPDL